MPLDVVRLVDSDLFALSTGDEFKAALTLWCKAWLQIPAGSLPNDDRVLAHLSGAGKSWRKLKTVSLRGFIECSDGRLYHPVIAEKVREAWAHRLKQRDKAAKRWDKEKPERGTPAAHATVSPAAHATANAPAMQGTGTGIYIPLSKDNGQQPLPVDPEKQFWDSAKTYLSGAGIANPGALVGKWLRDHGKAETKRAIGSAQIAQAVDPIPYCEAIFRNAEQDDTGMPLC